MAVHALEKNPPESESLYLFRLMLFDTFLQFSYNKLYMFIENSRKLVCSVPIDKATAKRLFIYLKKNSISLSRESPVLILWC